MSLERDRIYINLFRAAVRRLRETGEQAHEKSARAFYAELSIPAQYDADIFIVELSRGVIA